MSIDHKMAKNIVIEGVRSEDLAEFTSVIFRSHKGNNHYINSTFPDNLTSEGQQNALRKLQKSADAAEYSI